jgi:hypothetical protein
MLLVQKKLQKKLPILDHAKQQQPQTKQSYEGAKDGRNEDVGSRLKKLQQSREAEFKGVTRQ